MKIRVLKWTAIGTLVFLTGAACSDGSGTGPESVQSAAGGAGANSAGGAGNAAGGAVGGVAGGATNGSSNNGVVMNGAGANGAMGGASTTGNTANMMTGGASGMSGAGMSGAGGTQTNAGASGGASGAAGGSSGMSVGGSGSGTSAMAGASNAGGQGGMGGAGNAEPEAQTWLGVWAGAPQLTETNNNPPMSLANNTLRQLAYVSHAGSEVRLQISNEFGNGPVTLNKVHIAQSTSDSSGSATSAIVPATDTGLTFGGSESVTINQGEAVYSDSVSFDLPELTSVAISINFGSVPSGITGHPGSRTTSFIASGDSVSNESLNGASTTEHWYYITRLEVMAPESAGAIVTLGDSITDGRGSTTNGNDRWPDVLARRVREDMDLADVSVVNVGIGGNTVLSGGLGPTARDRFDRDVLGTANVRWVLIMEGVNDIGGGGGNANAMTSAYQEFIDKAHAAGVKAYGIPILQVEGSMYAPGDTVRQQINDWIRTSGAFDAVLPLDEAVADPNNPNKLRSDYQDGDYLHLSPQGYQALSDAIDLSLFSTQ